MTPRSAHLPRHAAPPARLPFIAAVVQSVVQGAHVVAAAWRRLAEDEDARFLRAACDLEDLEYRLRVLERGRRDASRTATARGPWT